MGKQTKVRFSFLYKNWCGFMLRAGISDPSWVKIEVWSACKDYRPLSTHNMPCVVLTHHRQYFYKYYYYPQVTSEETEAWRG